MSTIKSTPGPFTDDAAATAYEELKSDKALVCRNTRVTDMGPGFVYYVCLADGYLIECGCDPDAERRAEKVARAINLLPEGEQP